MYELMTGYISGAVRALENEVKYSREIIEEQRKVIEQLHRGYPLPGEPTLIHPYDLSELINKASTQDCWVIMKSQETFETGLTIIKGVRYKMSPFMPQIGKEIK